VGRSGAKGEVLAPPRIYVLAGANLTDK